MIVRTDLESLQSNDLSLPECLAIISRTDNTISSKDFLELRNKYLNGRWRDVESKVDIDSLVTFIRGPLRELIVQYMTAFTSESETALLKQYLLIQFAPILNRLKELIEGFRESNAYQDFAMFWMKFDYALNTLALHSPGIEKMLAEMFVQKATNLITTIFTRKVQSMDTSDLESFNVDADLSALNASTKCVLNALIDLVNSHNLYPNADLKCRISAFIVDGQHECMNDSIRQWFQSRL